MKSRVLYYHKKRYGPRREEAPRAALDAAGLTGRVYSDSLDDGGWYSAAREPRMALLIEITDPDGRKLTPDAVADSFWQVVSKLDRPLLYQLTLRAYPGARRENRAVYSEVNASGPGLQSLTRESIARRLL